MGIGIEKKTAQAMPADIASEKAIVRIVLSDAKRLYDVPRLNGWHFFDERLGRMFHAIKRLVEANRPVDSLTLLDQLRKDGELDTAGGAKAIKGVIASTYGSDLKACEEIVLQCWQRREGNKIGKMLTVDSLNPEIPASDVFNNTASQIDLVANHVMDASRISTADKVQDFLEYISRPGSDEVFNFLNIPLADKIADIQKGSLVVVSGSTGSGKSSLYNTMMKAQLDEGLPCYSWSGENSERAQINRLLAADSKVPAKEIKKNGFREDAEKVEAFNTSTARLSESKIFIESGSISGDQLTSKIRFLHTTEDCELFLIDRLELVNVSCFSNSVEEGRGELMAKLRTLVVDLDIRVVIACQLRKTYESRPNCEPEIVDLKGTSAIGDSATHIMLLTRPEYHGIMEDENGHSTEGRGKIMIVKNTEGEIGDVPCIFNKDITLWEAYDPDEVESNWKGSGEAYGAVTPNRSEEHVPF